MGAEPPLGVHGPGGPSYARRVDRSGALPTQDGPVVGLAAYDPSDPEGTFRPIEPPPPPPPEPGPVSALAWPLRVLGAWLANLTALAVAGLLLTATGPADPLAYVAWAVVFGLVNYSGRLMARLWRPPLTAIAGAGLPLVGSLVTVLLMVAISPPAHATDLVSIGKAAFVMWLANLPLRLLLPLPAARQQHLAADGLIAGGQDGPQRRGVAR